MKSNLIFKMLLGCVAGLVLAVGSAQAAVITLQSGGGTPLAATTPDPAVKVLQGAAVGDFATLTAGNFAAAQAGPAAFVVTPHPQWITPAAALMPTAQWVSVTSNGGTNLAGNPAGSFSGLYAISFNVANPALLSSAVLNMTVYADNLLGSVTNAGMYLNGVALAGSNGTGTTNSAAGTQVTLANVNIAALLVAGVNTLYFDVVNTLTGPSGLMFFGTVTTTQVAVPVSGVAGLLALGLLMLVFVTRRSARV
ncbi:MAG: hypothetical protein PHH47_01070 [Gallionella sp.]|nr:hypothetical protein [Gallionella sp.]MDD4946172.1 hypothetical protein [Gallionella sp.]